MKPESCNPAESFEVSPYLGCRGAFKWRDNKHTPQNKRHGSVTSTAFLTVADNPSGYNTDTATNSEHPNKGWTTIEITETTESESGRVASRTISVCLSHDARKELIAYLASLDR